MFTCATLDKLAGRELSFKCEVFQKGCVPATFAPAAWSVLLPAETPSDATTGLQEAHSSSAERATRYVGPNVDETARELCCLPLGVLLTTRTCDDTQVFSLPALRSELGVVTHSSGNHAAALALAAQLRGIPAYIVVPKNAPECKVSAIRTYGGRITQCEANVTAREAAAATIEAETGATLIPPYNHGDVISGQGTIALELVGPHSNPSDRPAVFIAFSPP